MGKNANTAYILVPRCGIQCRCNHERHGFTILSSNLLGGETSPYLRQHANNPVHWAPWGPDALARARREGRPILLSVGYAACHWCHVMAHESFENQAIADAMNERFVNIKVDREERPDIDAIYQHALALLGEHGGWPLTMFLTPDGEPFWGGTYFPPEPRYGRPGFPDVLRRIAEIYQTQPDAVRKNADALLGALATLYATNAGDAITIAATDDIAKQFLAAADRVFGGVGGAPKFPQPAIFGLLWRAWKRTGNTGYRDAVTLTLDRMCQGGIYDHLGGGFARYATDQAWLVPHFEKMLYDNAQLIELLSLVWQDTRAPLYERCVRETIAWMLREMTTDGGGFAGAIDADSDGEEGRFYVWQEAEIDALLGSDATAFKSAYNASTAGNWEGKNILNHSGRPDPGAASDAVLLARCRETLFAAREKRVRPARDDKVIADCNGLAISALAHAGALFDIPEAARAAEAAFAFARDHMGEGDGKARRLRHSWCGGRLDHPATLDDYANLCRAALALYEISGAAQALDQAVAWIGILDMHYLDPATHSYFFTAADVTDVVTRSRTVADNATPAGNATLVEVFARLYYLTGEGDWRARADNLVVAFSGELERSAFPLATLLNANELLQNAVQIAILGARTTSATEDLLAAIHACSVPNLVLHVVEPGDVLPPAHPASGKAHPKDGAVAYVCRGTVCSLPISDPATLRQELTGQ